MKNRYKLFYVLGVFFSFNTLWSQSENLGTLKEFFNHSYSKDICNYSILYKRLMSSGDTLTYKYFVSITNNSKEFSYSVLLNDTLTEIYYNEILIAANLKSKEYTTTYIPFKDICSDARYLFRPMIDTTFGRLLLEDSVIVNKIENSNEINTYDIIILNPGDIQSLKYRIIASKLSNSIFRYCYNATIAGMALFESWELTSQDTCFNEIVESDLNSSKFFEILKKFHPKCPKNKIDEASNVQYSDSSEIHKMLPYYKLISIDNDTIQLSKDTASFYLIDYWYRSCFPCIKSIPIINDLHKEFNASQLKIISINSIDKSIELIKKFIQDNNVTSDVFTSTVEKGKEFKGIFTYPTFVIYNRKWEVINIITGFSDNLLEKIKSTISPKD